jgi:hypothetical protein
VDEMDGKPKKGRTCWKSSKNMRTCFCHLYAYSRHGTWCPTLSCSWMTRKRSCLTSTWLATIGSMDTGRQ